MNWRSHVQWHIPARGYNLEWKLTKKTNLGWRKSEKRRVKIPPTAVHFTKAPPPLQLPSMILFTRFLKPGYVLDKVNELCKPPACNWEPKVASHPVKGHLFSWWNSRRLFWQTDLITCLWGKENSLSCSRNASVVEDGKRPNSVIRWHIILFAVTDHWGKLERHDPKVIQLVMTQTLGKPH